MNITNNHMLRGLYKNNTYIMITTENFKRYDAQTHL